MGLQIEFPLSRQRERDRERACIERALVVEVDGGQHSEQQTYDAARDSWLASQGYTVLRFTNEDALKNTEAVLEAIRLATLSPDPSPASGRGEQVPE